MLWIANQTRPDISNAVRAVARHSHEPKDIHWDAAKKILNYLLATAELSLKFSREVGVDVRTEVYVDADYASKETDRRYISGALVLVGGSPVAWFSRTQKCVTLSTTEAEYVAMGDGVKKALFINVVLGFMLPGTTLKGTKVLEDNQL